MISGRSMTTPATIAESESYPTIDVDEGSTASVLEDERTKFMTLPMELMLATNIDVLQSRIDSWLLNNSLTRNRRRMTLAIIDAWVDRRLPHVLWKHRGIKIKRG